MNAKIRTLSAILLCACMLASGMPFAAAAENEPATPTDLAPLEEVIGEEDGTGENEENQGEESPAAEAPAGEPAKTEDPAGGEPSGDGRDDEDRADEEPEEETGVRIPELPFGPAGTRGTLKAGEPFEIALRPETSRNILVTLTLVPKAGSIPDAAGVRMTLNGEKKNPVRIENEDPESREITLQFAAYTAKGSEYILSITSPADADKVDHNTGHTILVESTQSKISDSIVNPILNYGRSMSAALDAKEATYAPGSPNIDLTQFPDGKTIYIDPSRLPNAFSPNGGGLNIKMHPNQTVVFNILNENVKVGQVLYTFTDGVSWASDAGRERIAGSAVFNMPNAKTVELNEAIGMFLIPRTDSKTTITQSSEGWVITGGTITSWEQSNEWHNRNQNLSKTADRP